MNKILFFVLFLSVLGVSAQPTIQWQKSLGGTGSDVVSDVKPTSDGGYIIAGSSDSKDGDVTGNLGQKDCWVVKVSSTGVVEWQKTFGGPKDDIANTVQQTSDGGYIVGYSKTSEEIKTNIELNHWIVKFTSKGDIEWQKSVGGNGFTYSIVIQQTSDGGYIVAGNAYRSDDSSYDILVSKLNAAGVLEWQKFMGGSILCLVMSIQQTSDGGYVLAGSSYIDVGDGDYDYWIIKMNNLGAIAWQKSFGGSDLDVPYGIQQTKDGGYIVGGFSLSNDGDVTVNHGSQDFWILKLSSSGVIEWQKSYGGSGMDYARSISLTANGDCIVAGYSESNDGDVTGNHGGQDCWVLCLNSKGSVIWSKMVGGTGTDAANAVHSTSDGGFIIGGRSTSNDGDVAGNHGGRDCWIVKFANTSLGIDENNLENQLSIYPNPISNEAQVKVNPDMVGSSYSVYDQLGRVVLTGTLTEENTAIETDNLSKGVYIFSLEGKIKSNVKIIKQ